MLRAALLLRLLKGKLQWSIPPIIESRPNGPMVGHGRVGEAAVHGPDAGIVGDGALWVMTMRS